MGEREGLDFVAIWQEAIPYGRFVADVHVLEKLWEGVYRTARIPGWARDRVGASGRPYRFLALAEDWCWDAANTVPIVAKLCDETGFATLRVIKRDERPEIMDRYLTNRTRSIPIVIVLDDRLQELGHWGPRPRELQAWVMEHKTQLRKDEFYAAMRRWHVQDRGESVLREVLDLLR